MKVIDLLNKWANGEKLPTKICYEGETYFLINNGSYDWYRNHRDGDTSSFLDNIFRVNVFLNDEVEILDKEDEFIDIEEITSVENSPKEFYNFSKKINDLIKNQKKIIERFKNEEIINK